MDLVRQFEVLGRKQLAMEEGLELLRQLQQELAQTKASAEAWGMVAMLSNLTLIPLNCIVNAFELKAANSVYQLLARTLYDKFSRSGTRLDGSAKHILALLKKAVTEELKRKSLTHFVPGVNILVGLAEDSLAAVQVVQSVESGGREMTVISTDLDHRISATRAHLTQLGIQRAEVMGRLQPIARTA